MLVVEYKRTSQPWAYGTTVVHFMFVFHNFLKFVNNTTHNCLSYCHSKNGLFRKNSHNFWPSYFYMSFTKPHKSSSKLLLLCHSQSWNLIPRPFCYTKLFKNSCALKTNGHATHPLLKAIFFDYRFDLTTPPAKILREFTCVKWYFYQSVDPPLPKLFLPLRYRVKL